MQEERYIRRTDFSRRVKRLPVCFCIDTSGSMDAIDTKLPYTVTGSTKRFVDSDNWVDADGVTYMEEVMDGLKVFYEAILDDDDARDSCECAIVTFNDTPTLYEGFDAVTRKSVPDFTRLPQGNTNITPAIEMCLDVLEKQKDFYKVNRMKHYQPWLVLFTDGLATDDVSRIQYRLMNMQDNDKLVVYTMALGDDPALLKHLREYSKMKPIACKDADIIKKSFKRLAQSVSIASVGGSPLEDFNF